MRVSANAFLTMIAFVEKSTAPVKVIRNPAKESFFNPLKFAAAIVGRRQTANGRRQTADGRRQIFLRYRHLIF
jgi:hypothetical protein